MSTIKEMQQFTAKEKYRAAKQVISSVKTVNQICDEPTIYPNICYRQQADFFKGALERFKSKNQGLKKNTSPESLGKVINKNSD